MRMRSTCQEVDGHRNRAVKPSRAFRRVPREGLIFVLLGDHVANMVLATRHSGRRNLSECRGRVRAEM